jgi:hypothetical protein
MVITKKIKYDLPHHLHAQQHKVPNTHSILTFIIFTPQNAIFQYLHQIIF